MTQPRSELDGLLCFDLYAASRAVTAAYRPVLIELGLTYPQYLVLTVLWARGQRPIRYLADTLRLDHGTLTPLLRRMEDAGLVTRERDSDDERIVLVRPTEAGVALQHHAAGVRCRITDALGISAAQAVELQGVLRAITASASA